MSVTLARYAGPHRQGAVIIAAVALAASLAGCLPAGSDLKANTAIRLQARVLQVSEAAAANDRGDALKALEALAADLEAARGDISQERHRRIAAIIASVRADLAGLQPATHATAFKPATAEPTQTGAATTVWQYHLPGAYDPAPVDLAPGTLPTTTQVPSLPVSAPTLDARVPSSAPAPASPSPTTLDSSKKGDMGKDNDKGKDRDG